MKSFYFLLFTFSFFILNLSEAKAARLYVFPPYGEALQGASFMAELRLSTEGEVVNAVEARLTFLPESLEVVDVTQGGGVLDIVVEKPSFSNTEGWILFQGGITNGFQGDGLLGRVIFKGKKQGSADVAFSQDSRVFLHDGLGTLAETAAEKGTYAFLETRGDISVILARYHPDENAWYRRDEVYVSWQKKEGSLYSYVISKDPLEKPDEVLDDPVGEIKYESLGEGIFYFSLREKKEGEEHFGLAAVRRIMIDRTPPRTFNVQLANIEGESYAVFSTTDDLSGVERYEAAEIRDEGQEAQWMPASTPYRLADQRLRGFLKVRAIDRAGNETLAVLAFQNRGGTYQNYLIFGIIAGIAVAFGIAWIVSRRRKMKNAK